MANRAMAGRQKALAEFQREAMAMSQERGEDGQRLAMTAAIVGGGPAGMIAALALHSQGYRVKLRDMDGEFTKEYPAPGAAAGLSEPLVFSPESVELLKQWGLNRKNENGILVADFGPNARRIPFMDLRSLSGRLIRREPSECICIRAQDLCQRIREVLPKDQVDIAYKAKVLDYVDIAWGAALYLSDGTKIAGDLAIGADGIESIVRKLMLQDNQRDDKVLHGYIQWSGSVDDPVHAYEFYTDAIQTYLGHGSYATVYRLPDETINWTIVRPSKLEGANALAEWRALMQSWPINPDGSVDIPPEQNMQLRESFDMFDTDNSGALDFQELKVAMKQVGLDLSDTEIKKMAHEVDQDGSGVFEFVEFVEVVKLLLLKLREAEDAEATAEEMEELAAELEAEIQKQSKSLQTTERRIYEMRNVVHSSLLVVMTENGDIAFLFSGKGGAVGKLELEDTKIAIQNEIAGMKEQLEEANQLKAAADEIKKKKESNDEFEFEIAKDALGRWLRVVDSHEILRRLVLATTHPTRTPVVDKITLKKLSHGRITMVGQAAHPMIPGAMISGNECVQDARVLIQCLKAKNVPDEIPLALQEYSKLRLAPGALAQQTSRQVTSMYTSSAVDWDKIMEYELSAIVEFPMQSLTPSSGYIHVKEPQEDLNTTHHSSPRR